MIKFCNTTLFSSTILAAVVFGGCVQAQETPASASEMPPVTKKNALWFLKQTQKPVFAANHTLIPLTRWGWSMPYDVRVELAENWGYALEFIASANPRAMAQLDNPESEASRVLALARSDPKRYPLAVLVPRPVGDPKFRATLENAEQTWSRDAEGNKFDAPAWKTWSPEAPDEIYQKAAEETVRILNQVKAKAPIAILLNGGEYGQSVLGHSQKYWSQDPKILATKGDKEWFEYSSERKAHHESIITEAVRKEFPDRKLYLWYHFGFMPGALSKAWTNDYKPMRAVSDRPGQSIYYRHFNSGWTGKNDLLSNYLASVALATEFGDTLSYNWVCAGWEANKHFSERERYMGFLKCLYTGGQIGAVAGYFSLPQGGFSNVDLGEEPPSWLWQMMDLAEAQAMFSHLENFLRKGDLLPGPDNNRLVKTVAAYEFPTGDPDARVVARKLRERDEWLVTAWAATGEARDVTVTIPDLGSVTITARPEGSVYRATLKQVTDYEPPTPQLELLDKDGMQPSLGFAKTSKQ